MSNSFRGPFCAPGYTTVSGVTYSGSLQVDIHKPILSNRRALIVIHGGGWSAGARTDEYMTNLAQLMALRGFAVFNADYTLSLAGGYTPQTPITDVLNLVQWVRTNASTYNADSTRVALLGISAGGHLAYMAAITGTAGTTRPDCCIGWSPGTDLVDLLAYPNVVPYMVAYMGVGYDAGTAPLWDAKSPQRIVTSNCCPLRIVGSDNEDTVTHNYLPVAQYDDMHTAALAAGVDSTKRVFNGTVHGVFTDSITGFLGSSDVNETAAWILTKLP